METFVIIIPGLDAPKWPRPFSYLVQLYCWYFNLDTKKDNAWGQFKEFLVAHGFSNAVVFDSLLGISQSRYIIPAGKKLAKIIDDQSSAKIILFAYSLGAAVAEQGIKHLVNKEKVSKLICVASPHARKAIEVPKSVEIININSDADGYLNFANAMLYGKGYRQLTNAKNIVIPNLKHSQFNKNSLVKIASTEMSLYDYYLSLII